MNGNNLKLRLDNLVKRVEKLEAELTYWKETAKNWKDLYKETDSELQYFKAHASTLEKALTNSIRRVDK